MQISEFVCPDGYIQTKVPLRSIRLLEPAVTKARIAAHTETYARYCDHIANGRYANGVPIIYRTPKGVLFASDLRDSDMVVHAEQTTDLRPDVAVHRNPIHPMLSVKIIEVESREDIPVQKALYLERNAENLLTSEQKALQELLQEGSDGTP